MSATVASARNAVRHRVRDGVPVLDASPVPFNTVRLEELTDQIPAVATPVQRTFQARFADVPTARYMQANVVPASLVAYLDDAWTPTVPSVDVDANGNFTLPVAPTSRLLVTYAWQYLSDGEIDQFVDEARQWLREFSDVTLVPDGLLHALYSYAASRALSALARSATLARVRAGDSEIDWSSLGKDYANEAKALYQIAQDERKAFYTQGPEALDPTAVDVGAPFFDSFTPRN